MISLVLVLVRIVYTLPWSVANVNKIAEDGDIGGCSLLHW